MPDATDPRPNILPERTRTQAVRADAHPDDTDAHTAETGALNPTAFRRAAGPNEVGTLGPYRVVKQLGGGGMGVVYAAIDTRLNRKLALMLPQYASNAAAKGRFLREARAAAQIAHDNVVTVYEADERDGVPYIAMQLLQGYSLDEYLDKKGNPSIPQVVRLAREAAAGLAAAHKIGLVHRDVKPANLWLEAPGRWVKVLDRYPAYMSPEQARGEKVDARAASGQSSTGCVRAGSRSKGRPSWP